MSDKRLIPSGEVSAEIKVANSTFIASIAPVFSVDEAKAFIQRIRNTHADATHNVPVYIIGHPPSVIEHSNDDGEPSGTAGRPALSVLRGSGLGDIAIVITRYFGGTKLGKGGLVRAYSNAVRAVLDNVIKAEKVSTITTVITIPYSLFDQFKRLSNQFGGEISDQTFEVDITLKIKFRETEFHNFQNALISLTNGKINAPISKTNADEIFLLET